MIAEQMNLFCQAPASRDDDSIVKMERGTAHIGQRFKVLGENDREHFTIEFHVRNYTDPEGEWKKEFKQYRFDSYKELYYFAVHRTNTLSKKYDQIRVVKVADPVQVLEYFGDK